MGHHLPPHDSPERYHLPRWSRVPTQDNGALPSTVRPRPRTGPLRADARPRALADEPWTIAAPSADEPPTIARRAQSHAERAKQPNPYPGSWVGGFNAPTSIWGVLASLPFSSGTIATREVHILARIAGRSGSRPPLDLLAASVPSRITLISPLLKTASSSGVK